MNSPAGPGSGQWVHGYTFMAVSRDRSGGGPHSRHEVPQAMQGLGSCRKADTQPPRKCIRYKSALKITCDMSATHFGYIIRHHLRLLEGLICSRRELEKKHEGLYSGCEYPDLKMRGKIQIAMTFWPELLERSPGFIDTQDSGPK